jgi:hypothetical protein
MLLLEHSWSSVTFSAAPSSVTPCKENTSEWLNVWSKMVVNAILRVILTAGGWAQRTTLRVRSSPLPIRQVSVVQFLATGKKQRSTVESDSAAWMYRMAEHVEVGAVVGGAKVKQEDLLMGMRVFRMII